MLPLLRTCRAMFVPARGLPTTSTSIKLCHARVTRPYRVVSGGRMTSAFFCRRKLPDTDTWHAASTANSHLLYSDHKSCLPPTSASCLFASNQHISDQTHAALTAHHRIKIILLINTHSYIIYYILIKSWHGTCR
jgi:hypothetical protein